MILLVHFYFYLINFENLNTAKKVIIPLSLLFIKEMR